MDWFWMILAIIGTTMLPWILHQKFQKYENAPILKLQHNDEQLW